MNYTQRTATAAFHLPLLLVATSVSQVPLPAMRPSSSGQVKCERSCSMMLFGVVCSFLGVLILWQFSTGWGLLFLVGGLLAIGREHVTAEPPTRSSGRDYSSEALSYDISSKPRR
jgi:hypothetical protein